MRVVFLLGVAAGELARLDEGRFGLIVGAGAELRLGDDGPGDALLVGVGRRLPCEQHPRKLARARQILGGKFILRGAGEHAGTVGMLGEGGRKFDARFHRARVHGGLRRTLHLLLRLLVGDERSVARGRRLGILRIVVGGAFVLDRGVRVVVRLEERFGKKIVGGRRIRIVRERGQIVAVPARRLLVVLGLVRGLRAAHENTSPRRADWSSAPATTCGYCARSRPCQNGDPR